MQTVCPRLYKKHLYVNLLRVSIMKLQVELEVRLLLIHVKCAGIQKLLLPYHFALNLYDRVEFASATNYYFPIHLL